MTSKLLKCAAILFSLGLGAGIATVVALAHTFECKMSPSSDWCTPLSIAFHVLPGWLTVGVFIGLTKKHPTHTECCCRKCGFILRGISEPRCPECGEPI